MKEFPPEPPAADASPALFERGHLWLHEWLDGAPIRFQARAEGGIRFGDDVRAFGDVPPAYEHVVRHVREQFDHERLRDAVDDVESVVFFGRAMHRQTVGYDWERTPNFLGSDVWSADSEQYLLPDRVAKIYDRLGLETLATLQAEVRATDFDPGAYAFPSSAWYDGPVAGVLVRNKTGLRARLDNPAIDDETDRPRSQPDDAAAFARRHATEARFDAVAGRLRDEGRPVTFDSLYERTIETITRAQHDRLFGDRSTFDHRAFRSAVAERTGAYLAERE